MNIITIILTGFALAMDAFAVSVTKGMMLKNLTKKMAIKIALKDLKGFSVISNENEELIKIKTLKKELIFIRNNSHNDNLALAMSKVIKDFQ